MIGTFGPIVFEVSEEKVNTFDNLSRGESGRWAKHDVDGKKPVLQFVGPDLSDLSFNMRFDAALGVNPRKETDKLIRMVRDGKVYPFVLGGRRFGMGKWALQDAKINFERIDNKGNVLVSSVSVDMEEYV